MLIRELFVKDVTRDIPPVVYFHEQAPDKLADEVSEYIVTGGYPDGDPRAKRVKSGIHEQYVQLLRNLLAEKKKPGGPDLPASWISGFFGSGKSSFAKLLGLALDGVILPGGTPLSTALLARDDSPRRQELVDAWTDLRTHLDPIAVVFDIGAVARDNEHIHSAAVRQVQARLGYCAKSTLVAHWELKLERDGEWERFLRVAQEVLGRPWDTAKAEELAEDHFSHVLHQMFPDRYQDPTTWIDTHAGTRYDSGSSVKEAVDAIDAMLAIRAEGKTLFLVVDEVSQYIHQDETRMLKLQSFVSELGQRLKGAVWIFATGQQKLEEAGDSPIAKLKDRFRASLRVHLATTNIRDVVHKRLLKKKPEHEAALRELFQRHRPDLKLHAFSCEEVTEEDFVEVYPMLPGYVELLLQITSNLRTRSTRVQGDDHAIRGLLQLLGELFREQRLADREVSELVTLDSIFEVQHTALDVDVQTTLHQIFIHPDVRDDVLALRAARAVALLELIQEQKPTTPDLVAKCLYQRVGQGNHFDRVRDALERLRGTGLVSYSEKLGYKIQSSAGQEWQRERDALGVTSETMSELVREKLRELMGMPERARLKGRPFPYAAFYTDGRQCTDERVVDPRDDSAVVVDFRYLTNRDDRNATGWPHISDQVPLRDRLVWVVGEPGMIEQHARDLARARHMLKRYEARRDSLSRDKQRLLIEEQTNVEDLESRLKDAVAEAFLNGTCYFRGLSLRVREQGAAFATALNAMATRILPDLFPHFTQIAVTEAELAQLLQPVLAGPSTKFLETGLGILSLDAGKYVATCAGAEPARVLAFLESSGASGATLIAHFGKPPYGYPADVVKACVAGLLRGAKIRIRPEEGPEITSIKDPGTNDLFRRDRDLRKAEFFLAKETQFTPRDRIAVCAFFKQYLDRDLERDNDAIADAVYQLFPGRREKLREIEDLLEKIPGRPPLPPALQKLGKALEDCRRSRQVEEVCVAVKKHLDDLRDGLEQLGMYLGELNEAAIVAVRKAALVRDHQFAQLLAVDEVGEAAEAGQEMMALLKSERPWRDVGTLAPLAEAIVVRYVEARRSLITLQSAQADASRAKIKARDGFELLSGDQSHHVLRPLTEVLFDTTSEAVAPTLSEMRDRFPRKLKDAEDEANDRLDEALEKLREKKIVKVDARLHGRELETREQLKVLLDELEERIAPHLDKGKRVRIT